MQGKKTGIDVRSQVLLWAFAVAAAVVLAVHNVVAALVATIVVAIVWDRLDLTKGESTLPPRFLPVLARVAAGLALAVVATFVVKAALGDYAVLKAVWGIIDAHAEGGLEGALFIALDIAVFALMLPLSALLITAILAFAQRAIGDVLGHPLLPYGAGALLVLWGLPALALGGGMAPLLLSLLFGGFYSFARKNSVVTYFVVLLCLLACTY